MRRIKNALGLPGSTTPPAGAAQDRFGVERTDRQTPSPKWSHKPTTTSPLLSVSPSYNSQIAEGPLVHIPGVTQLNEEFIYSASHGTSLGYITKGLCKPVELVPFADGYQYFDPPDRRNTVSRM